MPLSQDDLNNIETRTKLTSYEMKEEIISAMQVSFDKHLETNHKPLEADIKTAQDRISSLKRIVIYGSGFIGGIVFLITMALKFGLE